jgi:Uncharacterised nucleotidyltransferase
MSAMDRIEAVSAILLDSGRLRIALKGTSMLPSLAEPMVLQLGTAERAGIGDVLVFHNGSVNVAHRVVAIEANGFRTAGDAQPHVVESVPFTSVLGRVVAVWSDGSHEARRVDGRAQGLRGWYYARFHRVRRLLRITGGKARDLIERAQPQRRARATPRLVAAIGAVARGDSERLVTALGGDAAALATIAKRHRCDAMLGDAARRFGVTEQLPTDLAVDFRRARLDAVIATGRMELAVNRTVAVLRSAGIEFALLKGAARVYSKMPGAAFHPSDDVDIFVPARAVDLAVLVLQSHGWDCAESPAERRRFRMHHHHAVPLYSPSHDFPVEIHHELALPGTLSLETTWNALRGHLVRVEGSAGTVWQLDRVGTALHLAIHAIGLARLRDIALLAMLLPTLTLGERRTFWDMLGAERRDPVRLAASVALASRATGMPYPERRGVASYIRWALRREDLPLRLRRRCDAADLWFARPDAPWAAMHQLAPWWTRGTAGLPLRIFGRCATSVVAAAYATQLPDDDLELDDQRLRTKIRADAENVAFGASSIDVRHGDDVIDDAF